MVPGHDVRVASVMVSIMIMLVGVFRETFIFDKRLLQLWDASVSVRVERAQAGRHFLITVGSLSLMPKVGILLQFRHRIVYMLGSLQIDTSIHPTLLHRRSIKTTNQEDSYVSVMEQNDVDSAQIGRYAR